ncbi:hypothetical protein [Butyricicoccus pullicaecorum]|uniref:hypothetical protein n=1 Tax=Butyricicoccus pullicaecorum TaxID=501571 RepID=UPI0011773F1A|nr:hypothetical protein [Butyricicoccus pullicaecorum]
MEWVEKNQSSFEQGIERRLLEIVRWTISTAVAFPAGKAIPPGGTTYFLLKKKVSKENFSESDCVAFSKCTVFPA